MSPVAKLVAGLVATLFLGWMYEGPLGNGTRFIDSLQTAAQQVVDETGVPGVSVTVQRSPAARVATLAGHANDFQRKGQGTQMGLTEIVGEVPGMGTVRWTDEPGSGGFVLPLLVEMMILALAGFAAGLGVACCIWRRPRGSFD